MKPALRYLLHLLLLVATMGVAQAQSADGGKFPVPYGPSNLGKEFVFSFPTNYEDPGATQQYIRLYITAPTRTRVQIYTGTVLKKTMYTVANDIVTIDLTKFEAQALSRANNTPVPNDQVYRRKAVRVVADDPIVVYGMNRTSFTSDGMLIFPTTALGTDYVVASATDVITGWAGYFLPSQYLVTAAFDNTTVSITTPWETPNHRAGETFTIQLSKGDVFSSMSYGPGGDLTGTIISASKPVAVTAGQNCTFLPDQRYWACDHLEEMMMPVSTWGTTYHSIPFATRLKGDMFRIFAADENTEVYINGVKTFTLSQRGGPEGYGWVNYLPPVREHIEFRANKPIMIAQYNNSQQYDNVVSDPFYLVLSPVEQFQTEFVFATPSPGDFEQNYMTVVSDAEGYPNIELAKTGSENWQKLTSMVTAVPKEFVTVINGRRYLGITFALAPGAYKVRSTHPMAAYVYGFGSYDSYGYPLSAALADLRSDDVDPPVIEKTIDCSGTVDASVLDMPQDNLIRSNLAQIDLIDGTINYAIEVEEFEAGVAPGTGYILKVIDRTKDARAIVRIYDKAGNVTYDTVDYTAIDLAILPTPDAFDFGSFFTGTTGERTFTLTNRSPRRVTISETVLKEKNKGFEILEPTATFILDSAGTAGATMPIKVRFTATTAGEFKDSIGLRDECGFLYYAEVKANVGTPIIEVTDHDFGPWPITAPGPTTYHIELINRSTDGGILTVTGVQQDLNDKVTFTLPNGLPAFPLRIAAGAPVVLNVAFKPAAVQAYIDSIVFSHNAPPNPANDPTGILKGRGIVGSLIATSHDFGRHRVGTGPIPWTLKVQNIGTAPVTLRTPLQLAGDMTDFRVLNEGDLTNKVLAPNEEIDVNVVFTPTATGNRQMVITYPHDPQQAEPVTSTLTGFGTVPALVTTDYDFGSMDVGVITENTNDVVFRLPAASLPTMDSVTILSWQLSGDVTDFRFVDPGVVILKPGSESVTIQAFFNAKQPGTRTARLLAVTADGVDTVSVWTGVGIAKAATIDGSGVTFGILCNEARTLEAVITSTGQVPLEISAVQLTNLSQYFSLPAMYSDPATYPIVLGENEELRIPITYVGRTNEVPQDGFLTVINNSTNNPTMNLRVTGASVRQDVDAKVVLEADGPGGRAELAKEFTATVRIDEQIGSGTPVSNLTVTVTYDPKQSQPRVAGIATVNGDYPLVTLDPQPITTPGTLVVNVSSPVPFAAPGDLFTVPFQVIFHEDLKRTVSAEITQTEMACLTFTTAPATIDVEPICGLSMRVIEMTSSIYKLNQNSPNPFNPTTKINYSLGLDGRTQLLLHDASGKLVQTLFDEHQAPGTYEATLDVTNLPSGLYYYTLQSGAWSQTRTMMVTK